MILKTDSTNNIKINTPPIIVVDTYLHIMGYKIPVTTSIDLTGVEQSELLLNIIQKMYHKVIKIKGDFNLL